MKQTLLKAAGEVILQDVGLPIPQPDELLIRVSYAGVCGSDKHSFRGSHPFRSAPVVLGHELSGTVAAMGASVEGFTLGDPVTVMPYVACGTCRYCRMGRDNLCEDKVVPGQDWAGTFGEYFVSPAAVTFKLGEHTGLDLGALAEPLAVGVHSASRARIQAGTQALVLGGGSIGLLTAAAAHLAGADSVAVTDLYEHNLAVARQLGAEHTYPASRAGLVDAIHQDYPDGFDVIFLTSGAGATFQQALALAQRGARVIVSAFFTREVSLSFLMVTIHELELLGSQIYQREDFGAALAYLDAMPLPFASLITHTMPLDRAQEALSMLDHHSEDVIKVLLAP